MGKLLKAMHLALVGLMLLYCGGQLGRLLMKWLAPTDQGVRFWTPGMEMVAIAVAFFALLGIFACSIGAMKQPSVRLLVALQAAWLICLTFIGWTAGGPFRLQELVGIDLADPTAVRTAELLHLLMAVAVYLVIAIVTGLPLLRRWDRNAGGAGHEDGVVAQR